MPEAHEVMGKGKTIFDPGQVNFLLLRSGQQPSLVCVWKFFPKNPNFLNFSLRVEKISLGQVKKWVGL